MKEQKWDDSIENSAEFLESAALLPEDEAEAKETAPAGKSKVAELRRRIEARLDSKRIDHEYDYDELDELQESLQ
jgi:hypothetical protein